MGDLGVADQFAAAFEEVFRVLKERALLADAVIEAARDVRGLFSATPTGIGYGVPPDRVEGAVRSLRASIEAYDAAMGVVPVTDPASTATGAATGVRLPSEPDCRNCGHGKHGSRCKEPDWARAPDCECDTYEPRQGGAHG